VRTLMVATDFSERSDRALRRATLLARQSGASLSLVHVVDDDQPERIVAIERLEAEQLLAELAETVRLTDGVPCEAHVVLADPFEGIVRAVAATEPDLLLIGPHRRQVLRDIFIGTTAERTIRAASCPVLMANAPPVGRYRRVLLATDYSESSMRAARTLLALGICKDCHLVLVNVFEAPAVDLVARSAIPSEMRQVYLEETRSVALQDLAAFAKDLGLGKSKQIVHRRQSGPAREILAVADEEQADLIVLGTRGRGRSGTARVVLGSVAEEVLRHAKPDVLAVPVG
jgi:nucleotide-binding universal stress UspA family protein